MKLVTQAEAARVAKVSRSAIADAIKREVFFTVKDGKKNKIDLDDIKFINYLKGNRQRQKVKTKELSVKKIKTGKKESTSDDNRTIPTPEQAETILDGLPEDLRGMSKHDLDRMKVAINVLKERFVHDEKRGMFVARALVHKAFGDLYQIDRQEFLESPSYIAPRICQNVFKTSEPEVLTQVSEILSNEFHKVQANIKNALDRNLEAMKVESIEAHS